MPNRESIRYLGTWYSTYYTAHCPKNNPNLRIKAVPVASAGNALVYILDLYSVLGFLVYCRNSAVGQTGAAWFFLISTVPPQYPIGGQNVEA